MIIDARLLTALFTYFMVMVLVTACGGAEPVAPKRYAQSDALIEQMTKNISAADQLRQVADIDHSRLGNDAGSPMPPARVLIIADPKMEAQLIKHNALIALDLPLRVLAFEPAVDTPARVIYNGFDYLVSRYRLDSAQAMAAREAYEQTIAEVTAGIPVEVITSFSSDSMQPDGIVTIDSPYDFAETVDRVNAAIDAQGDTMHFGVVDFQAQAREQGIDIPPSYMILFGGPGPGGKAMNKAPTLGLDAFCQKFLVWQDASGRNYLSYNDLLALAERQEVGKSVALRVIAFRLDKEFGKALNTN